MPGTGLTARNTGSEALVNAFEVETAELQRSEIEVLKKGQVPLQFGVQPVSAIHDLGISTVGHFEVAMAIATLELIRPWLQN